MQFICKLSAWILITIWCAACLSATSPPKRQYFVSFISEHEDASGLSGHAFVMWGVQSSPGHWVAYDAFGQWPAAARQTVWSASTEAEIATTVFVGHVPGIVVPEVFEPAAFSHQITVPVSEAQFIKSHNLIDKIGKSSSYDLLGFDCVGFTALIAKTVGMRIPNRAEHPTPGGFIAALQAQNADFPGQYYGPYPHPYVPPSPAPPHVSNPGSSTGPHGNGGGPGSRETAGEHPRNIPGADRADPPAEHTPPAEHAPPPERDTEHETDPRSPN